MNLIYNEYIKFLKDKGIDTEKYGLNEGYYWLDKQIIKAYDKQGKIHKILRLNIQDDLSIQTKEYKTKDFKIESWQETVERNKNRLLQLKKESLELIKSSIEKYSEYEPIVLTSTGKDSQVVTYLMEQVVGKSLKKIFNNTSMDCAETYRMVKNIPNCTVVNPNEGFYQWQKRTQFIGNRASRACCLNYKEKILDKVLDKNGKYLSFMGMRNSESHTRSSYEDEWVNSSWTIKDMIGILPIRKWSEEEIWLYTLLKNIEINPKYKYGYHRVGCNVVCAFYTKSTWVLDQYWYPKAYERWHKILEKDFVENKKACVLNCSLQEYHLNWNGGIVHDEPTEETIQEFAKQQELDINIARKYFNKTCMCCSKKLKKDDVGMSMKYYGRNIENFKCLSCLGKDIGLTKKELKEKIKDFKNQDCVLF